MPLIPERIKRLLAVLEVLTRSSKKTLRVVRDIPRTSRSPPHGDGTRKTRRQQSMKKKRLPMKIENILPFINKNKTNARNSSHVQGGIHKLQTRLQITSQPTHMKVDKTKVLEFLRFLDTNKVVFNGNVCKSVSNQQKMHYRSWKTFEPSENDLSRKASLTDHEVAGTFISSYGHGLKKYCSDHTLLGRTYSSIGLKFLGELDPITGVVSNYNSVLGCCSSSANIAKKLLRKCSLLDQRRSENTDSNDYQTCLELSYSLPIKSTEYNERIAKRIQGNLLGISGNGSQSSSVVKLSVPEEPSEHEPGRLVAERPDVNYHDRSVTKGDPTNSLAKLESLKNVLSPIENNRNKMKLALNSNVAVEISDSFDNIRNIENKYDPIDHLAKLSTLRNFFSPAEKNAHDESEESDWKFYCGTLKTVKPVDNSGRLDGEALWHDVQDISKDGGFKSTDYPNEQDLHLEELKSTEIENQTEGTEDRENLQKNYNYDFYKQKHLVILEEIGRYEALSSHEVERSFGHDNMLTDSKEQALTNSDNHVTNEHKVAPTMSIYNAHSVTSETYKDDAAKNVHAKKEKPVESIQKLRSIEESNTECNKMENISKNRRHGPLSDEVLINLKPRPADLDRRDRYFQTELCNYKFNHKRNEWKRGVMKIASTVGSVSNSTSDFDKYKKALENYADTLKRNALLIATNCDADQAKSDVRCKSATNVGKLFYSAPIENAVAATVAIAENADDADDGSKSMPTSQAFAEQLVQKTKQELQSVRRMIIDNLLEIKARTKNSESGKGLKHIFADLPRISMDSAKNVKENSQEEHRRYEKPNFNRTKDSAKARVKESVYLMVPSQVIGITDTVATKRKHVSAIDHIQMNTSLSIPIIRKKSKKNSTNFMELESEPKIVVDCDMYNERKEVDRLAIQKDEGKLGGMVVTEKELTSVYSKTVERIRSDRIDVANDRSITRQQDRVKSSIYSNMRLAKPTTKRNPVLDIGSYEVNARATTTGANTRNIHNYSKNTKVNKRGFGVSALVRLQTKRWLDKNILNPTRLHYDSRYTACDQIKMAQPFLRRYNSDPSIHDLKSASDLIKTNLSKDRNRIRDKNMTSYYRSKTNKPYKQTGHDILMERSSFKDIHTFALNVGNDNEKVTNMWKQDMPNLEKSTVSLYNTSKIVDANPLPPPLTRSMTKPKKSATSKMQETNLEKYKPAIAKRQKPTMGNHKSVLDKQELAMDDQQKLTLNNEHKLVWDNQQKLALYDQQKLTLDDQQNLVLEKQQKLALEKQQKLAGEKYQKLTLERQHKSALERQHKSALERQHKSALERHHKSALERRQKSALERRQKSVLERQQKFAQEKQKFAQDKQKFALEKQTLEREKHQKLAREKQQKLALEKQQKLALKKQQKLAMAKSHHTTGIPESIKSQSPVKTPSLMSPPRSAVSAAPILLETETSQAAPMLKNKRDKPSLMQRILLEHEGSYKIASGVASETQLISGLVPSKVKHQESPVKRTKDLRQHFDHMQPITNLTLYNMPMDSRNRVEQPIKRVYPKSMSKPPNTSACKVKNRTSQVKKNTFLKGKEDSDTKTLLKSYLGEDNIENVISNLNDLRNKYKQLHNNNENFSFLKMRSDMKTSLNERLKTTSVLNMNKAFDRMGKVPIKKSHHEEVKSQQDLKEKVSKGLSNQHYRNVKRNLKRLQPTLLVEIDGEKRSNMSRLSSVFHIVKSSNELSLKKCHLMNYIIKDRGNCNYENGPPYSHKAPVKDMNCKMKKKSYNTIKQLEHDSQSNRI